MLEVKDAHRYVMARLTSVVHTESKPIRRANAFKRLVHRGTRKVSKEQRWRPHVSTMNDVRKRVTLLAEGWHSGIHWR